MKPGYRIAAYSLLLVCMAGCRHKEAKVMVPPQATAPTRPPAQMAEQIPPLPPVPAKSEGESKPVMLDTTVPPETERAKSHRRVVRHHPKSSQDAAGAEDLHAPAQPPANTEIAAGEPSGMSPIGQLSTAGGNSTSEHDQIQKEINTTEAKLNGIRRLLTTDEQKTAAQIRAFITKAREALQANDLVGAQTLSTKAKLLLQELTQP